MPASGNHTTSFLAGGPQDGPLMIFCHGWPAIGKTWLPQLGAFSKLGFRVVAPDMPGYGRSIVSNKPEHYSLENVNSIMGALLTHLDRDSAIWIGHDWGAVAVWSFAAHYPEKVSAVVCLARPYHTLEYGLEEVLKTVNRVIYPIDQFPYAQYDYQVYFQTNLSEASAWFEQDVEGVIRAIYAKGNPTEVGKPGLTANVNKAGGWFGGAPAPPPQLRQIPADRLCVDEKLLEEIVQAMKRQGSLVQTLVNRKYSMEKAKDGGYLSMPVLFVGANWDPISDVMVSDIAKAQKEYCKNLREVYLDAGHWVGLEKPDEVNVAIAGYRLILLLASSAFTSAFGIISSAYLVRASFRSTINELTRSR
ncbi:Bifunctional epoxide hydrolase 2 [Pseudocercospora fuligena]|uniref:Bifunctional epoxide hydrolase 2 n=1 Tax=Pseudocercospora fuligena TaxID=685502 RepID=A0A8H6R7K8_9PEZI|nr:Bifunctional epoxide hydrolase 2 [Pseudocercospora fuligena]